MTKILLRHIGKHVLCRNPFFFFFFSTMTGHEVNKKYVGWFHRDHIYLYKHILTQTEAINDRTSCFPNVNNSINNNSGGFFRHRKNYEESMMVRLNMPKRQKNSKKRGMMSMSGQLSGITHFGDITALTGGEGGQVSSYTNICISSHHLIMRFIWSTYLVGFLTESGPKTAGHTKLFILTIMQVWPPPAHN